MDTTERQSDEHNVHLSCNTIFTTGSIRGRSLDVDTLIYDKAVVCQLHSLVGERINLVMPWSSFPLRPNQRSSPSCLKVLYLSGLLLEMSAHMNWERDGYETHLVLEETTWVQKRKEMLTE